MNKNIIKTIIFTCIIMVNIILINIPESNSKFITSYHDEFAYEGSLKKVYAGEGEIEYLGIDTENPELVILGFNFDRNGVILDEINSNLTDTYTFTVPYACQITAINTSGSENVELTYGEDQQHGKIIFNTSKQANMHVNMKCVAKDLKIGENLEAKIDLKEQIGKEDEFLYKNYFISKPYQEYEQDIPKPPEPPKPVETITVSSDEDLYQKFEDWILAYAENYDMKQIMRMYIEVFSNAEDKNKAIKDAAGKNVLNGVIISTIDGTEYTFSIGENLLGYAKTAFNASHTPKKFYFNTKDETSTILALKYYVKEYAYKDNSDLAEAVIKYIDKNEFSNIINNSVKGIEFNTEGIFDTIELINIERYVSNYESDTEYVKEINVNKFASMIFEAKNWLSILNIEDLENKIAGSAATNGLPIGSTDQSRNVFSEYFITKDTSTNNYVIVNVHSDEVSYGTDDLSDDKNIINIVKLKEIKNTVNISFENTKTKEDLKISIKYDNEEEINNSKKILEGYFNSMLIETSSTTNGIEITKEYRILEVPEGVNVNIIKNDATDLEISIEGNDENKIKEVVEKLNKIYNSSLEATPVLGEDNKYTYKLSKTASIIVEENNLAESEPTEPENNVVEIENKEPETIEQESKPIEEQVAEKTESDIAQTEQL